MARQPLWHDDYWLLLMQLYLKSPVGVKPLYSRGLVDLAMELHLHPAYLHRMMERLDGIETPRIKAMLERYSNNRRRLARDVEKRRGMEGFGDPLSFYEGVEVNESFETRFKPLPGHEPVTEVMLVIVLDLYYRLTPQTMAVETPEVAETAKLLKIPAALVVKAMRAYCLCDPCIRARGKEDDSMLEPCRKVWNDYADADPTELAAMAAELKEYYR